MIIDTHIHTFPDMSGASGFASAADHLALQQSKIQGWWGKMLTSTLDPAAMPLPGEAVNFRVGRFGRYYWEKNGQTHWLQRFPLSMDDMSWSAERMVANMDALGIDVGVLQASYMHRDLCQYYFQMCIQQYPGRFISTTSIDYDTRRDDAYLQAELDKLRAGLDNRQVSGLYQGYPKHESVQPDDPRFDPLWRLLCERDVPHILLTGFEPKARYLDSLARLVRVKERFPTLKLVIGHLGGNVRHPSDPEHTPTPEELLPLLRQPEVYFEVGYMLAYENQDIWGSDYEYPYPRHQAVVQRVYEEVGAERLLWASDMPNNERSCTYRQCLDLIRVHSDFLSETEKQHVLHHNPARVFRVGLSHFTQKQAKHT